MPPASQPARIASIKPTTLAFAGLFALIVLAQGISAPFQKDAEPQSAEWIQSIVRDGHWLIPHDAYGFIDRKPPLFYWLSATVAKLSGGTVDEVRARVVSLAAGTALAVCVLGWTAANVGAAEGWLAFLFLLGTYGFASRATEALTDMLLTLLLFAPYSLLYPLLDTPPRAPKTILIGAILGLAILTKGPVAIVLCALSALIYLLLIRQNPLPLIRKSWLWQLLAVSIAVAAIWYLPAMALGGQKILKIIFAENFGHFMPTKLGGTGESYRPFYFIAARLAGGAFPMILLIPPSLLALRVNDHAPEKRRSIIYQASMPLAVLLFFSIASVKRDDYILPALPGIAILCASAFTLDGIRNAAAKFRDAIVWIFFVAPVVAFVFLIFFPGSIPQLNLQSSDAAYYAAFREIFQKSAVELLIAWMVWIGFAILSPFRRRAFEMGVAFGVLALLGSLCWTAALRPFVATMRSVKSFVPIVAEHVKGDQLCIPAGINYELSYYYGAAVPDLKDPHCGYLLATPRELDAMTPEYRARLKLVAMSNLIGGGGPPALFEISPEAAR